MAVVIPKALPAGVGGGGGTTLVVNNYGTIVGAGGMDELAQVIRLALIRWGRGTPKIGLA